MQVEVAHVIATLQRTPAVLHAWLGGMDDAWARANYGPGTFSAFDVVGHLVHGELVDWMPRARQILRSGEDPPFAPFEIDGMHEVMEGRTLEDLLAMFAGHRAENVDALRTIDPDESQLDRRGTHPALGTVTLRELLATWVVHDLHHLAQIAKALAHQYGGEVGPWRAYLGILPRPDGDGGPGRGPAAPPR
jgi:uncharacterized damage-inducible protein DinB